MVIDERKYSNYDAEVPDIVNALPEKPFQENIIKPINGQNAGKEEEDQEEDLVLGDEDAVTGNEEEYDVELDEDVNEEERSDNDLILGNEDDIDEENNEDL